MHADSYEHIGVFFFQRAEFIQDVQTVHAAKCPEVEDNDLAAKIFQAQILIANVEPGFANQF